MIRHYISSVLITGLVLGCLSLVFITDLVVAGSDRGEPWGCGTADVPRDQQIVKEETLSDPLVVKGESLYKENCTPCHDINYVVTGPALIDITKRRTMEWLIAFTRNSQEMIKNGDKKAVALFKEYNGTVMNSFINFSDNDIRAIYRYIESQPEGPVAVPEVMP